MNFKGFLNTDKDGSGCFNGWEKVSFRRVLVLQRATLGLKLN